MTEAKRRTLIISVTAILCTIVYFGLPTQGDFAVNELARRTIVIFVIAAIFWATEAMALYATSLAAVGLMVLFLDQKSFLVDLDNPIARALTFSDMPEAAISYKTFFAQFGSNIIILFMGGFLLSAALTKHGIDRAIAARVLAPFAKSPIMLIYGVLAISAFFSMWMSNTATAAMVLAIIAPIIKELPHDDKFHRGVILAVPFGANIGGIGTPIGTPPNAVAFGAINGLAAEGVVQPVSFLQWMMIGVPLAVILLAIIGVVLYLIYKPGPETKLSSITAPGKITAQGYATIGVLVAAIALWLTGTWHGLSAGAVALLAAAALTAMRVLEKTDVDRIDWNILILMWGGLALGAAIQATGMTDLIAKVDFTAIPGDTYGLAVVVVLVSILMSTFMSNTATANLLVPIVMALGVGAAAVSTQLAVLCALGCSFAMALPVSTPPNAIAFATGKIKASELLRIGGMVSLGAGALLLIGYPIVLPMVLGK